MSIALPLHRYDSVTDITASELHRIGARAVAFDLDNTTMYDSSYRPRQGALEWVKTLREAGFPMIILTNTYTRRARKLAKRFGVDYIANAEKPSTKGFFEAARRMGVELSQMAMVGDQLFKDIEGANRAGAISVWVRPFMTEKLMYFYYRKIRAREKALFASHGLEW